MGDVCALMQKVFVQLYFLSSSASMKVSCRTVYSRPLTTGSYLGTIDGVHDNRDLLSLVTFGRSNLCRLLVFISVYDYLVYLCKLPRRGIDRRIIDHGVEVYK